MLYFLRIYLPIFFIFYLFLAFILPSYRTYKTTGINPIVFGNADNAHDYIGFVMKLLVTSLFLTILVFSFSSKIYAFLQPILFLNNEIFDFAGLIISHIALIWISVAQYQMKESWRIGIDEINSTDLKVKGLFSVSRNPIFLGMLVSTFGVFLILPNIITFFILFCTYFIIHIQIRLEEHFLEKQHGEVYRQYKKSVRRLL